MKKLLKKFYIFTAFFLGLGVAAGTSTIIINSIKKAEATSMFWHLRGRKRGFTTEINGKVEARYIGLFWYDRIFWNGLSRAWAPTSKVNSVEHLIHNIEVWVEGSGTPSINTGISFGTSGISTTTGISTNPSGNRASFVYNLKNQPLIEVDFSTSGYIWRWSYVGWKTRTTFLVDGYRFLDVDGEANAVKDSRIWTHTLKQNTTPSKFATPYDNWREVVDSSTEWPYDDY